MTDALTWLTPADALELWPGAPANGWEGNYPVLSELLDVAKAQVIAYAPLGFDPDTDVTPSIRRAQLMQARNLWNAARKDENGGIGPDGYQVVIFPLDWNVKNLIRPQTGMKAIF